MHTRGKLSLAKSLRKPKSHGGMFWREGPPVSTPQHHRLIWRCALSPRAGVCSTTMLLGGLWPLLFLWISVLLLSPSSLTPVPTLELLDGPPGPLSPQA